MICFVCVAWLTDVYSATVGLNLAVVVMFYIPDIPIAYGNLFGVPEIALMNIMACLVYRNVRFGIFRESASDNRTVASSGKGNATRSGMAFKLNSQIPARSFPGDVERGRMDLHEHKIMQMDIVELDVMSSDVDTMDKRRSLGEDKLE